MKIVKLTEEDLFRIVNTILNEQGSADISDMRRSQEQLKTTRTTNKYENCVPLVFAPVIEDLINQGYNKRFLKVALGIIGRESDFGKSARYQVTSTLKSLWAYIGGQTSVGLGQIKPNTAKKYGLSVGDLNTAHGALRGVYKILKDNYNIAIQKGYSDNKPSSNLSQGTGSAALDMAIIAFNLGASKITKYCQTSDPNIKRPCSMAGQPLKVGLSSLGNTSFKPDTSNKNIITNKWAPNYIPNFESKRWDGVNITSHGYVKEVAKRIKSFNCF